MSPLGPGGLVGLNTEALQYLDNNKIRSGPIPGNLNEAALLQLKVIYLGNLIFPTKVVLYKSKNVPFLLYSRLCVMKPITFTAG